MTRFHPFSRALLQVHVLTSTSDWFVGLLVSFVFIKSNNFGFGLYDCLCYGCCFYNCVGRNEPPAKTEKNILSSGV